MRRHRGAGRRRARRRASSRSRCSRRCRSRSNLEAARRHGIKPGDVRRAAAILVQGIDVGSLLPAAEGLPGRRARHAGACARASTGARPADRRARRHARCASATSRASRSRPTPSIMRHDAVSRYVDVRAAVSGRGVDAVRADVRDRLRAMHFPLDYHAEVVDALGRRAVAAVGLPRPRGGRGGRDLPAAAGRVRSWRLASLVFVTLPMALVGGLLVIARRRRRPVARRGVRPDGRARDRRAQRGDARPRTSRSSRRTRRSTPRSSCAGRPTGRARRADGARHGGRAPALRACSATSPATRSPTRWRWSSSAGSSPRRC